MIGNNNDNLDLWLIIMMILMIFKTLITFYFNLLRDNQTRGCTQNTDKMGKKTCYRFCIL